jgi:hypothetical protein
MANEVIVRDHAITDVVPGECIGYDEAVRLALAEGAEAQRAAAASGTASR